MFKRLNTFAIGGLENIGYIDNNDTLIVLSGQGRGVFDCLTGQKIYRDDENWWQDFDEATSTIHVNIVNISSGIKTSGLFGERKLPSRTVDGWELSLSDPYPDDPPFEKYNVQSVFLKHGVQDKEIFVAKDGPCEVRAFGFSDTGNTFVVALSCELIIWKRE
ncbi:MAG: hypothetical protein ABJA76_16785 [Mucilaginibacter sp.]